VRHQSAGADADDEVSDTVEASITSCHR